MTPRRLFSIIIAVVLLVVLAFSMFSIFENLDAGQVMVIQSPVSGDMTWHTTPGVKWQRFGKVTDYQRRSQFWFSSKPDQGKTGDESLKIRFNDGGHAQISGAISWEMPLDAEHLTPLHQKFGNMAAIEAQLVRTMVEKAVYMTGPLMSSTESYAARRNDLLHLIEDQIQNGIYATQTVTETQKDPLTGVEKKVSVVHILTDKDGKPMRVEESPLLEFKVIAPLFTTLPPKVTSPVPVFVQDELAAMVMAVVARVVPAFLSVQLLNFIHEAVPVVIAETVTAVAPEPALNVMPYQ